MICNLLMISRNVSFHLHATFFFLFLELKFKFILKKDYSIYYIQSGQNIADRHYYWKIKQISQAIKNQLHAVSRTQQGRHREPSVKTLRTPLSAEFWRHCVLSVRTPPCFASTPERRNGNINLNKYFISSSGDRTLNQTVLQSHFVPLRHDWPHRQ